MGNRLVLNASGALTTSTFDAANQTQVAVAPSGTTTYTLDAAGNQQIVNAPSGITTSTWNYENQCVLDEQPGGTRVTMAYNPNFLRVHKDP